VDWHVQRRLVDGASFHEHRMMLQARAAHFTAQPAGNGVQCVTALLASTALSVF
jgi:hypothetical protein